MNALNTYTAVVTLLFATCVISQAQTKPQAKFNKIDLKRADNSMHFVTPFSAEGKESFLIIDSGSGASLTLSKSYTNSLNKKLKNNGTSTGVAGTHKSYSTTVNNFQVSNFIKVKSMKCSVKNMSSIKVIKVDGESGGVHGTLGSPFLKQIRAVFNPSKKTLLVPTSKTPKLFYAEALEAQGALRIPMTVGKYNYPIVTIKIKEQVYDFLLDTGSPINILLADVAKELKLETKDSTRSARGSSGGKTKLKIAKATNILVGNKAAFQSMDFYVIEKLGSRKLSTGKHGGIIGVNFLLDYGFEFDYDSYSLIKAIPMPKPKGKTITP